MTTGTTSDSNLTRDELITLAYRKLEIAATDTLITRGAQALNLILREEDAKGTGQSKNLWALSESALILTATGTVYGTSQGLESNILELSSAVFRNTSGEDVPVEIIGHNQYEAIGDKNETGDPTRIYLKRDDVTRSSQRLYVFPTPASIGTTSEVTGTDSLNYACIMGHTAAAMTRPITGQDWRVYWRQTGSAGAAWVTATAYTNGELIHYIYKRPLYDFDTTSDNPDMPSSWSRYLMWRLANDLSPEADIDMESRQWLKQEFKDAAAELFGSTRVVTTDLHNKSLFYSLVPFLMFMPWFFRYAAQ
jgi:hypothetical protein